MFRFENHSKWCAAFFVGTTYAPCDLVGFVSVHPVPLLLVIHGPLYVPIGTFAMWTMSHLVE